MKKFTRRFIAMTMAASILSTLGACSTEGNNPVNTDDIDTEIATVTVAAWEEKIINEASGYAGATATIDFSAPTATVNGSLYNAGYNGWRDITSEKALEYLGELPMEYLRIPLNLTMLSPRKPSQVDMSATGSGEFPAKLAERVATAIRNGWTPVLAPTNNYALPSYFHGDTGNWFTYNRDGTVDPDGFGNQTEDYATICGELCAALVKKGYTGLVWETFFETHGYGYVVDLHYLTARAIREADPTAIIWGPATFPGWAVETGFAETYIRKYGVEYLDAVSIHLYASNFFFGRNDLWDYQKDILTIEDRELLEIALESPAAISTTAENLSHILSNPAYNPDDKEISVVVTECDVNAYSAYQRVPDNAAFPEYSAASDCYLNTNYFGGVFSASCILNAACCETVTQLFKYNTRHYYGLLDHDYLGDSEYYRTPVYMAQRLLSKVAGITRGAEVYSGSVKGAQDNSSDNIDLIDSDKTYVSAVGVDNDGKKAVVLLNRSFDAVTVNLSLTGLAADNATLYVYCDDTTADFIGHAAGNASYDGYFEGTSDDTANNTCLKPVRTLIFVSDGDNKTAQLSLDGLSFAILKLN